MSDKETYQKHLLKEAVLLLNDEYEACEQFNEDFDGYDTVKIRNSSFKK